MKGILLFTVMLVAITAKSQSLLDAVYSGKIKADTGAVLRKSDSLKIKDNMAQKVIADSIRKDSIAGAMAAAAAAKQNATIPPNDTLNSAKAGSTAVNSNTSSVVNPNAGAVVSPNAGAVTGAAAAVTAEPLNPGVSAPKDNNKIWKAFIDSFATTIKSEVLSSGKIKKGAYSVLINYEIKPDGQVNISSVASDPQSSFLDEQIKLRLTLETPQLNPVLGTNGQPRTVAKKQMLTFVK